MSWEGRDPWRDEDYWPMPEGQTRPPLESAGETRERLGSFWQPPIIRGPAGYVAGEELAELRAKVERLEQLEEWLGETTVACFDSEHRA